MYPETIEILPILSFFNVEANLSKRGFPWISSIHLGLFLVKCLSCLPLDAAKTIAL